MSMPVLERHCCVQVCNPCVCRYRKDDVVFMLVIHVYADRGKITLCSNIMSMPV